MDDDGTKSLDFEEFMKGMETYGLILAKESAADLFRLFDKDGSGTINFDEFLEKIRVHHIFSTCTRHWN